MSHQDWNDIVFKKNIFGNAKSRGLKVSKERTNIKNEQYKNTLCARKVENEEIKIKKIELNLSKTIQTARLNAKLTQKDLANKLNLKTTIIQNYESGKAVPNKTLLYKMGKMLNIHLTGKNIGTPMKMKTAI